MQLNVSLYNLQVNIRDVRLIPLDRVTYMDMSILWSYHAICIELFISVQ